LPLVKPKHRVMVGAELLRPPFSACNLMEWATQRPPIYRRGGVNPETNDSTRGVVHDDEDPMGFESDGLTSEEIHAPQTVLRMTKEGQPGEGPSVRSG